MFITSILDDSLCQSHSCFVVFLLSVVQFVVAFLTGAERFHAPVAFLTILKTSFCCTYTWKKNLRFKATGGKILHLSTFMKTVLNCTEVEFLLVVNFWVLERDYFKNDHLSFSPLCILKVLHSAVHFHLWRDSFITTLKPPLCHFHLPYSSEWLPVISLSALMDRRSVGCYAGWSLEHNSGLTGQSLWIFPVNKSRADE